MSEKPLLAVADGVKLKLVYPSPHKSTGWKAADGGVHHYSNKLDVLTPGKRSTNAVKDIDIVGFTNLLPKTEIELVVAAGQVNEEKA